MKIRTGFVSNSSSSSYIVRSKTIPLKEVQRIFDECCFEYFSEKYKKIWGVEKLSRRQINAVRREIRNSLNCQMFRIDRFDSQKMKDSYCYDPAFQEIKENGLEHNIELCFKNNDFVPVLEKLERKLSGVYVFWG